MLMSSGRGLGLFSIMLIPLLSEFPLGIGVLPPLGMLPAEMMESVSGVVSGEEELHSAPA